jgi:hypothetical protein
MSAPHFRCRRSRYGKADFSVAVCFSTDCRNSQRPGGDPDWTAATGPRRGGGCRARSGIRLGRGISPVGWWPLCLGPRRMADASAPACALGPATLSPVSWWLGFRTWSLALESLLFRHSEPTILGLFFRRCSEFDPALSFASPWRPAPVINLSRAILRPFPAAIAPRSNPVFQH